MLTKYVLGCWFLGSFDLRDWGESGITPTFPAPLHPPKQYD